MNRTGILGRNLMRACFPGLLLWQVCWHGLFSPPLGTGNWLVAIFAMIPLLVLIPGVVSHRNKPLQWAIFVTMLYFMFAVMELWSNPPQRWVALIQLLLTIGFFTGFVLFTRRQVAPELK